MLECLNNVFLLGRNGCFRGCGGLNFVMKKVKIFDFSCMLVIELTVIALLKYVAINGKNHAKSHQKSFVFCNMKYYKENLLELPV